MKPERSELQEVTVFHGSPPEDVEHAKSFWKSLTLQPPLESRLVSAEIRQRIKAAPPPSRIRQVHQIFVQKERERKELEELSKKIQDIELRERYERLARKREETLELFYKQRAQRLDKEMIRNKVYNC